MAARRSRGNSHSRAAAACTKIQRGSAARDFGGGPGGSPVPGPSVDGGRRIDGIGLLAASPASGAAPVSGVIPRTGPTRQATRTGRPAPGVLGPGCPFEEKDSSDDRAQPRESLSPSESVAEQEPEQHLDCPEPHCREVQPGPEVTVQVRRLLPEDEQQDREPQDEPRTPSAGSGTFGRGDVVQARTTVGGGYSQPGALPRLDSRCGIF